MEKVTNKIVPLTDYILFRQLKRDTTEGGIALPESAQQDIGFKVVSVGPKVKNVKVGNFIVFPAGKAIQIQNEGIEKDSFLIKNEEIIGTMKKV